MKFSIFYVICPEGDESEADAYQKVMEQCQAADELGYYCAWFAEHHFSKVGMCPDPLLWCAALAQKTKNIRLGTAISIMPFHNPVRLAEQAAVVDLLSGGRLELGVGRGSQPKEFKTFGVKPSESRKRLVEGMEIVSRLLEGEQVTFEGEYYQCKDVQIFPQPIQKPRPPIWLAGTSPETYTYAGKNGFKIMASAGFKGPQVYREKMKLYEEAVAAAGGDTSDIDYTMTHRFYVCEDNEQADYLKSFERGLSSYLEYRSRVNEVEFTDEEGRHLQRNWSYKLDVREFLKGGGVIGSAKENIQELYRLRDDFGLNHVILGVYGDGMKHEESLRLLERFAKEVAPAMA